MRYEVWIIVIQICLVFTTCKGRDTSKPLYDEPSLKDFVFKTHSSDEATTSKQLDSILNGATNDSVVFHQTISFLETPFSNPNSSYRNQNLYSKLLNAEINSKWYNGYEKEIAAGKLKLLQQNNVGKVSNDFTYITPAGYKKEDV